MSSKVKRTKAIIGGDIASSEITPKSVWLSRRGLLKSFGVGALAGSLPALPTKAAVEPRTLSFQPATATGFVPKDEVTPKSAATTYNNFYEFGTDKSDPADHADEMKVDPWQVNVGGLVAKPGKLSIEDVLGRFDLEERIYRFRCVEAWSMVVPWVGFPLSALLKEFEPLGSAKYVAFETLYRPDEMRGTRSFTSSIDWPYREGLRLDEAMHPLTLIAVGMYGETLPNQNGAPLRLVVPWKYGFKNIKSIVSIKLTEKPPATSWTQLASHEYGFYANVNPEVDHPRWSQRYERRLPSSIFNPNRMKTTKFNGYGEQVASLYSGMDLAKFY